jgi:AraC-like DNA-binding protein
MEKQSFFPRNIGPHNTLTISTMGVGDAERTGVSWRTGSNWCRSQTFREETFSLVALQEYHKDVEEIGYTRQQGYLKVNFWLSGKHTTVLNGFGQHQHEGPEVFITAGPAEMLKVDVLNRDSQIAVVALCVLSDFFPKHMGLSLEELPRPLRSIVDPVDAPYSFSRFPLTAELAVATRAILVAPFGVRRDPLYARAKAVELMCLLLHQIDRERSDQGRAGSYRLEARIHEARELILRRFAEPLTLQDISREVGLNRMALTSGFRELFGDSVHDFLQRVRMEKAYELLQDGSRSIIDVSAAVGYTHACNFSTAFRAHFGCSPGEARKRWSD